MDDWTMLTWLLQSFRRAVEGDRLSSVSIEHAVDVVEKHGMKAHLYLPGTEHRGNDELCHALDTLSAAGFIITNDKGHLVGKVATKRLDRNEAAKQRRAELRLVE